MAKRQTARSVLIPLAEFGSAPGRIARVVADVEQPRRDLADLDPRIAALQDWSLYEAGAIALGAVQRLRLQLPALALAQRLRPDSRMAGLAVTNGPDLLGLSPENGRSAELGLALGLLMLSGQSATRQVIATGQLARDTAPGSGLAADDVAVEPVGELPRKLEALAMALGDQQSAVNAARVPLFLPERTSDGALTSAACAREIDRLVAAGHAAGVSIEVHPIASLRQALAVLGVERRALTPADRLAAGALATAACLMLLAAGVAAWLGARIDLTFDRVALGSGGDVASPARAVFASSLGRYELLQPCRDPEGLPLYRAGTSAQAGDSLILRIGIANRSALVDRLGGYRFAVVTVSEHSGVKVFPMETFRAPPGGMSLPPAVTPVLATPPATARATVAAAPLAADNDRDITIVLPVRAPTEPNKVIVLMRPLRPFDAAALDRELRTVVADKPPAQRINAVVAHLSGRAPGYLDYSFLGVEGEPACASN